MMGEYDAGYENCIDAMVRQMEDMQFRIDSLHRENAKLRELVLTLYMCSNIRCGRCKYGHGNTCDFDAENELRELGIEVEQ